MKRFRLLPNHQKNEIASLLFVVIFSSILGAWWLRFILFDSTGKLLASYGDLVWNLAAVQTWMSAGPISADQNLANGIGFDPWKLPQMGMLSGLISWIGGFLGFNVNTVFGATVLVGATLNSVSLFFLFTQITRKFEKIRVLLSIYLGAGVFTFGVLGHSQVRQYYVLYFLFGCLIKTMKNEVTKSKLMFLILFFAVALSPTWPMYVMVLILFLTFVITLLRKEFIIAKVQSKFLGITILGLMPQAALYVNAREKNSPSDRGFWDSNVYGGHLLDFFMSSPWLNSLAVKRFDFKPGISVEPNQLGLFGGVLAVVGLVFLLGFKHRDNLNQNLKHFNTGSVLDNALLATTLLFITGGFGNLLSGLTSFLGFPSPGRAYSRLLILIAVLGSCKMLHYLSVVDKPSVSKRLFVFFLIAGMSTSQYVDFQHTPREAPFAKNSLPEFAAITYIAENSKPNCTVAQFPVDTFPTNQVSSTWADVPNFHFRGFVPYLLDPTLRWSFGYANPLNSDINAFVGSRIESKTLTQLETMGVCAVLFDNLLSSTALERGIDLIGVEVTSSVTPTIFGRFSVYIL